MSLPPIRREHAANSEQEPLLGQPGDNTQSVQATLGENLVSGTAPIAQAGAGLLAAYVAYRIFKQPLVLFSAHPILNVIAIAILLQSALLLQPTHTPEQKRIGAISHSIINGIAAAFFYSALAVIVVNKLNHNGTHFQSPHAILGLITYIFLFLNASLGIVQFYFPNLVGGVENGKALYKHHRAGGYFFVLLVLSTVVAATYTDYNIKVLHISTTVVVITGLLVLAGTLPRVKLQKLGLKTRQA